MTTVVCIRCRGGMYSARHLLGCLSLPGFHARVKSETGKVVMNGWASGVAGRQIDVTDMITGETSTWECSFVEPVLEAS